MWEAPIDTTNKKRSFLCTLADRKQLKLPDYRYIYPETSRRPIEEQSHLRSKVIGLSIES